MKDQLGSQQETRGFVDELRFHAKKCDAHLARAQLALVLGKAAAQFGVPTKHTALVKRAVGASEDPERRMVEALTRSLFLDLKANFELFLWTCCRTCLRYDFEAAVNRVASAGHKSLAGFVTQMRAADRSSDEWEDLIPVQGLSKLTNLLNALAASTIERAPSWSQVSVSFAVRHLIEHRNGKVDDAFEKSVKAAWVRSSWGERSLELPTKVEVTPTDFDATYEAMQDAVAFITDQLLDVWRGLHDSESTVRIAARLPNGTIEEVEAMSHADAADAMRRSPGGAVRVIFDPRTQTAEEIAAHMRAIRQEARRAAGLPEDAEPVDE